jgi:metal-responsive CopG/Arc/MetJ family transcriptional regulator
MIVCFLDIGGIVDDHCLEMIVRFVDFGGIVDHHCLEVIVVSTKRTIISKQ